MMNPNLGYVEHDRHPFAPRLPEGTFHERWRPAPLRRIIEDEIERLIAFLDHVDGDPDIEANGDEGDYSEGVCSTTYCTGANPAR